MKFSVLCSDVQCYGMKFSVLAYIIYYMYISLQLYFGSYIYNQGSFVDVIYENIMRLVSKKYFGSNNRFFFKCLKQVLLRMHVDKSFI